MGRPRIYTPEEAKEREQERKRKHARNMTPEQRAKRVEVQRRWREKNKDFARQWRQQNPAKQRQYQIKAKYGLTPEQWDLLVIGQEGRCAICNRATADLAVDHCADTMKVRGLLCLNCNVAIGHLRHDPTLLERARSYLLASVIS